MAPPRGSLGKPSAEEGCEPDDSPAQGYGIAGLRTGGGDDL